MIGDSRICHTIYPSYGVAKGKYVERNSYSAIVVHTTGYGPVRRHKENPQKYESPLEAALDIYRKMPYGPHYVIGQEGDVVQMCPENLAAWHVGGSKGWRYKRRWATRRYSWWLDRWRGLESPRQLAGGKLWSPYPSSSLQGASKYFRQVYWRSRHGSVNANTIGIEIVPPESNPRGEWAPPVWQALTRLCRDIHRRRGIPLERSYVLTHSDCSPIGRTTRTGEPWDTWPSQFSWGRFVVAMRTYYGGF